MTSKFTFSTDFGQDFIDNVTGNSSFNVKVLGYWSSSSITAYIRRDWYGESQGWKFEISHSSGGRDTDEVKNDDDAEENFGLALIACAEKVRELRALTPVFEANYQAYLAKMRAEAEAEKLAKQTKLDADPAFGQEAAEKLVKIFKINSQKLLVIYDRCTEKSVNIHIQESFRSGQQQFLTENGTRWTRNQLIAKLAKSSIRSSLV